MTTHHRVPPTFSRPRLLAVRTAMAWPLLLALAMLCLLGYTQPVAAQFNFEAEEQQASNAERLWEDFAHYVRIRRLDLAKDAGTKLQQVEDRELLQVIESSAYENWQQVLDLAAKFETLKPIAEDLARRIQQAKISLSREQGRILEDIRRLAEGPRANLLATERLREAGQYAAPLLLQTLLDDNKQNLHPYVLSAMIAIGRSMVYPLSVSLKHLEPVPMAQVAQVLSEIGYPRTLPYLREAMEDETLDPSARRTVAAAYRRLSQPLALPRDVTAADLYLTLGENLYGAASQPDNIPNYDPALGQGIVWEWGELAGLVQVPVPGVIYGDVLAMRAARQSLRLNQQMDPALSLWLMANTRRENKLTPDMEDRSYPEEFQPAAFYLKAAGPLRQHDVLDAALDAGDTPLALDAIEALGQTAGTDALVNRQGAVQPLLRALSYPDRRVRFNAALTMAQSRPRSEFPGSQRVVPVLAEAVRQTEQRYALVLADDTDKLNETVAMLDDLGYRTFGGENLGDIAEQLNAAPGVDLIVLRHSPTKIESIFNKTRNNYKLAAVPVLALTTPSGEVRLSTALSEHRRFHTATLAAETAGLEEAIRNAAESYAGKQIDAGEAEEFALAALDRLFEMALFEGGVFDVRNAQPALEQALNDPRDPVVIRSAEVLALIDNPDAQRAIAEAALDPTRFEDMQISLLNALADSATAFGNMLQEDQLNRVLELVKTTQGELAEVAARAHGALTLPTANVVDMLTTSDEGS